MSHALYGQPRHANLLYGQSTILSIYRRGTLKVFYGGNDWRECIGLGRVGMPRTPS
jgi:hypothetical protein